MSIVVAVAASDGLALATDSRTIQTGKGSADRYRVLSDATEKLFVVGSTAVATYGVATVGDRSVRALMEEFAQRAPAGDLAGFADQLGRFFQRELHAATPSRRGEDVRATELGWPLGFLVAGYELSESLGSLLEVRVRADHAEVAPQVATNDPGVVRRGQTDVIDRMLDGIDLARIGATGVKFTDHDRKQLGLLHYDLMIPTPIEETARLAQFLVHTQIEMQRFHDGAFADRKPMIPGCGGAIRSLAVTKTATFWIENESRGLLTPDREDAAREPARAVLEPAQQSA